MTSAEWANAARAALVWAISAARSATSLIITTRIPRPGVKPTVTIAGNRSPFLRQSTASYSPWPTRETSWKLASSSLSDSEGQYGIGGDDPSSSLSANPVSSHIFALTCAMRPSASTITSPSCSAPPTTSETRRSRSSATRATPPRARMRRSARAAPERTRATQVAIAMSHATVITPVHRRYRGSP